MSIKDIYEAACDYLAATTRKPVRRVFPKGAAAVGFGLIGITLKDWTHHHSLVQALSRPKETDFG
jgi:hypothetical protein